MTDPVRRRLGARAKPRALLPALCLPILLLVLSGCALQFKGAGILPASGGDGTARFTVDFRIDEGYSEYGGTARLRSTYSDTGGFEGIPQIAFKTTNATFAFSLEGAADNCMWAPVVPYTSLTSGLSGDGKLSIFACDNGPFGDGDFVSIEIYSGPLAGYENSGELLVGDFKAPEGDGGGGGGA